MKLTFQKYTLDFKFSAGTSRGVLKTKDTYIIKVFADDESLFGLGECGPLKGLSIDDREDLPDKLNQIAHEVDGIKPPKDKEEVFDLAEQLAGSEFPSVRFGLEVALLDLLHGGKRIVYNNSFLKGKHQIPINGLIWMGGHMEDMLLQVTEKVNMGFNCIKMKVGSLDFDKECDILQYIRRKYYQQDIIVRVDANGAFKDDALNKLQRISAFNIHSIEQPIKPGQPEMMARLCKESPIDIALDEELIGVVGHSNKKQLLETINPPYIILKPTLLGGIKATQEWIDLADKMKIGWWLTSALESNIGLNAITQYAAELGVKNHQGLGTGQLYHNNFDSPLNIQQGFAVYTDKLWDLSNLTI